MRLLTKIKVVPILVFVLLAVSLSSVSSAGSGRAPGMRTAGITSRTGSGY